MCVVDKATGVVGKGFGKAKDKVTRNKGAPGDEDPTDDEHAIIIHQEPDKHAKQKHRGDRVGLLSQGQECIGMLKFLRPSSCVGPDAQRIASCAACRFWKHHAQVQSACSPKS